ncbi:hypothetical protein BCR44DRAFT_1443837 [Catenaria anguillulae PL171]|uniref:Uncharacterized protein n=1 Tax=Catenaria anguillulae PL171 TaxID=765915 RepID=A0A1Y2H8A8_9FUNG|nr:hypothetical protein BCR44DRAFT_1443837 [Catenaria anguillulae PL171]
MGALSSAFPVVPSLVPYTVPSTPVVPSPMHAPTAFVPSQPNSTPSVQPASFPPSLPAPHVPHWTSLPPSTSFQMTIPQVTVTSSASSPLPPLPWEQPHSMYGQAPVPSFNPAAPSDHGLNPLPSVINPTPIPLPTLSIDWDSILSPAPAPSIAAAPAPLPPPTAEQIAAQNAMFDWLLQPLGSPAVAPTNAPSFSLTISDPAPPPSMSGLPRSDVGMGASQVATPNEGTSIQGELPPCPIASLYSDVFPSN